MDASIYFVDNLACFISLAVRIGCDVKRIMRLNILNLVENWRENDIFILLGKTAIKKYQQKHHRSGGHHVIQKKYKQIHHVTLLSIAEPIVFFHPINANYFILSFLSFNLIFFSNANNSLAITSQIIIMKLFYVYYCTDKHLRLATTLWKTTLIWVNTVRALSNFSGKIRKNCKTATQSNN